MPSNSSFLLHGRSIPFFTFPFSSLPLLLSLARLNPLQNQSESKTTWSGKSTRSSIKGNVVRRFNTLLNGPDTKMTQTRPLGNPPRISPIAPNLSKSFTTQIHQNLFLLFFNSFSIFVFYFISFLHSKSKSFIHSILSRNLTNKFYFYSYLLSLYLTSYFPSNQFLLFFSLFSFSLVISFFLKVNL